MRCWNLEEFLVRHVVGLGEPGVGSGRTPSLDLVAVAVWDVQAPRIEKMNKTIDLQQGPEQCFFVGSCFCYIKNIKFLLFFLFSKEVLSIKYTQISPIYMINL